MKEGKNRYTFAQTTFGYDMEYTLNGGYSTIRNANNELEKVAFDPSLSPVISISGLHFWGHAEFFTGFSVGTISLGNTSPVNYKRNGSTGFKVFPWAIRDHSIRPYIGAAVSTYHFQQGEGVIYKRADYPLMFGLTYTFKKGLLEIGCNYHYDNERTYYISKNESVPFSIPVLSFNVDYKYYFDLSTTSLKQEKNGELESNFQLLKKHKSLNSFSLALGPAYSFMLGTSTYNEKNRPYLDDHQISRIYPDIGLGYYHYKWNANLNLSWRFFTSKLSAYNVEQSVRRNSLALEAYKFMGDYHGFVPFVGAIVSYERFTFKESDAGNMIYNFTDHFFAPGIIVGWDIRPTKTDWWGVRTNIRYFPNLQFDVAQQGTINMEQIELNFLQMVLYPNRIYTYLKHTP